MFACRRSGSWRVPWQVASVAAHVGAIGGALWLARPPIAGGTIQVLIANPEETRPLRAPRAEPSPPRPPSAAARATPPAKRPQRRASPRPGPDSVAGPLAPVRPELALAEPVSGAAGKFAFAGEGSSGALALFERARWRGGFEEGSREREASEWLRAHYREIVRRIQSRIAGAEYYPWSAQIHGRQGLVRVAFTLRWDGTVGDARVVASSGHSDLDRCAVAAVRATAPFPRPPRDEAVVVPIRFVLQ